MVYPVYLEIHCLGCVASPIKFCCIWEFLEKSIKILIPRFHPQNVLFDWSWMQPGHWKLWKPPLAIWMCSQCLRPLLYVRSSVMRGQICLITCSSEGKFILLVSIFKTWISTFLIKCVVNACTASGFWKNSLIQYGDASHNKLVSIWELIKFLVSYNLGCNLQVALSLQCLNYYLITEPKNYRKITVSWVVASNQWFSFSGNYNFSLILFSIKGKILAYAKYIDTLA